MVGRELEVLVEGPSERVEYLLEGRHEGQAPEIDGGGLPRARRRRQRRRGRATSCARASTGFADYDLAATIERTIAPTRMKRAPTRLPVRLQPS